MTILTDTFLGLALAQARSRGRDDLALVVVRHPVGGLEPGELAGRISDAVAQLRP